MRKLLYFALAITAVASSATAQSIPEIRLTPAEVLSGDKGDSRNRQLEACRGPYKNPLRQSDDRRLLLHLVVRATSHHDSGPFSS